jgi:TatD DNase family protein
VREAARYCPADRLLIETDSPYLAPVPHRGKLNRPAWVPLVGACIAELRGEPATNIRASVAEASRHAFPRTG